MTIYRETVEFVDRFNRPQAYTTTPGQNGWTIADTSSGGAPTYLNATEDGGKAVLTLANDTEVENVCLFHNDVLMFDLAHIHKYWAIIKVAAVGATTVVAAGLGNARADDEDTVGVSAWFKMEGAASTSALVVETDDDTTNSDDVATGESLAAVYKKLEIDFQNGLADVRFLIDGDRVAAGTTFDMSAVSSGQNVQPIFQISKGSTSGTPALHIAEVGIRYTQFYGA